MPHKEGAYGRVEMDVKRGLATKQMKWGNSQKSGSDNDVPYFVIREMAFLQFCRRFAIPFVIPLQNVALTATSVHLELPLYAQCLYDFLAHEKSITERIRVGKLVLRTISESLAHLHHHCILYRDMKPSNLLLNAARTRVVLTDFGGCRDIALGTEEPWQLSNEVCTYLYMAPESHGIHYSFATDIYSFGVTVFQIMTGTLWNNTPLSRETLKKTWLRLSQTGKLDSATFDLILNMTQPNPAHRPTALEISLAASAGGASLVASATAAPPPLGAYWEKHRISPNIFSAALRKEMVLWLCQVCAYLQFGRAMIWVVQLFDEFLAMSAAIETLTTQSIKCSGVACISLIYKYLSMNAPHPATLLVMLHIRETTIRAADVMIHEIRILQLLSGDILPRGRNRLLQSAAPLEKLPQILSHSLFVQGPLHFPKLILGEAADDESSAFA